MLEALLAASHESLSYLDWFYSLHPIRLLGAKRLVVLLPAAMQESLDEAWLDEIEDRATIHWADHGKPLQMAVSALKEQAMTGLGAALGPDGANDR